MHIYECPMWHSNVHVYVCLYTHTHTCNMCQTWLSAVHVHVGMYTHAHTCNRCPTWRWTATRTRAFPGTSTSLLLTSRARVRSLFLTHSHVWHGSVMCDMTHPISPLFTFRARARVVVQTHSCVCHESLICGMTCSTCWYVWCYSHLYARKVFWWHSRRL